MLKITRLTDYATLILAELAKDPSAMHSAKVLSTELGIGLPTVAKILKMLAQEGLVASTRGAEGGYQLKRAPGLIRITDIIHVMEGPFALTECAMPVSACEHHRGCSLKQPWQVINRKIFEALNELTLNDMLVSTELMS